MNGGTQVTNVLPQDVGKAVQAAINGGATSITCTKQANGNWTITGR
jgi:hypothetical protein